MVIMTKGMLPIFQQMGVEATDTQIYLAFGMSPWVLKPLIGVFSDLVAFNGYHKKNFMLFALAVGVAGAALLVSLPQHPALISIFLVCVHFSIAVGDLFMEAQYSKMMRQHPETGSTIVTFATAFQQLGYIIAMAFIGPLADLGLSRINFIIALALCCTPVIPTALNWLLDEQIADAPWVLLDTARLKKNWRVLLIVSLTGLSAPIMGIITTFAYKWLGLLSSVITITIALAGGYIYMPHPLIAKVALYQVLAQASRISFSSAMDYFFTADGVCLPDGPNFSYKFYITIAGLAGATAAFLSSFFYHAVLSKWTFRNVLLFTTILSSIGGLFDYVILMRWNLSIGIPDSVFFLIGDDVIESMIEALYWIPSSSIIGKVCVKNMESSLYAYLAGIANYGKMMSVIAGAMLTEVFGVHTIEKRSCNWAPLPWLVLGGHVIVMLIFSVPASFLIPNKPQDEQLIDEEQDYELN